jgi:hypothetical protein
MAHEAIDLWYVVILAGTDVNLLTRVAHRSNQITKRTTSDTTDSEFNGRGREADYGHDIPLK